ncbi:S8 family serine peptidase [Actinomadura sp. LD22]|uniref:S8 family serine peptidase n=1 Tax=Actinomadura physcomitrii TaxID=2650748 RepID=A0A6I4MJJ4_9ACTN|nr:S8 family serine peptidase [Actinomadura physcomitrii]MWA06022.1 S8 family serine peptidase [Actinomadura physcomitrii]
MRRLIQAAATAAAMGLALGPVTAAHAGPIEQKEWWFDSWGIRTDVWPQSKGAGVTVAVVDTGVNASLPDLKSAVVPGKAFNASGQPTAGDATQDEDPNEGHGTAMASLIASRGTQTGFYGIAPEAKILPMHEPGLSPDATSAVIRYAADHGAKVINFSQGASSAVYPNHCPPKMVEALKYADKKNVVVVAASGNSGDSGNDVEIPGSCPGVLTVGAVDHQGKPWEHTQRQDYVTVAAPGAGVGGMGKTGHVYNNGEGTSQATALTSGAVALLRSKYPQMTARRAVQVLTNTAKDFGTPGKDDQLGFGVISIPRALKNDVPQNAKNPVYDRLDKAVVKGSTGGGGNQAAPATKSDSSDSGGSNGPLIIGGIVVVVVLVGAGLFIVMRRRKPSGAAGASYAPFPNGPQPMGQPGTPPSFGGNTGGQPLPPQGGGQQFQAPPQGRPNPNLAPPQSGPNMAPPAPQGPPNPNLAPPPE